MKLSAIEDSIILAATEHFEQVDKSGNPYIFHLIRVMLAVPKELQHIAVLHDILEDTNCDEYYLSACGYDDETINIISILTRSTNYAEYINLVKMNEKARIIKIADLQDHLSNKEAISQSLIKRYERALAVLT